MFKKIYGVNAALIVASFSLQAMQEQSPQHIHGLQLIVLNGASCAGKSSLAQELVKQAKQQGIKKVTHFSFDDFFIALDTPGYFKQEKERLEEQGITFFADPKVSQEKQTSQHYFLVFYQQLLERMNNFDGLLIADLCFSTPESFIDFLQTFKDHRTVALIKVFCSTQKAYERLEKRNKSSDTSQHRLQWCMQQHYEEPKKSIIHGSKEYDAGINTSEIGAQEAAQKLSYLFKEPYKENTMRTNARIHSMALENRYGLEACSLQ